MNDPMNPTTTPTTDTTVNLSSEQSSINDALNPTAQTATTTTTTTATPVSPSPLSMSPTPPQPMTATETTTTSVAMGDDTPLAFASLPSAPSTTTTTTSTVNTPIATTETAFVPPVPGLAPTPSTIEVTPAKPKSKMGKIMALFFGFLVLGAGAFGGYRYYVDNYGVIPTIAPVTSTGQADCESRCDGGHKLAWRNGKCVWRAALCDEGPAPIDTNVNTRAACEKPGNQGGIGGAWCVGCGGFCNVSPNRGCYDLQEEKCGEGQQVGANIVSCTGSFAKDCRSTCGRCYDRTGDCSTITGGVEYGLCGITGSSGSTGGGNIGTQYYYCPGMIDETQNGCQILGKPSNPNCFCGTTQEDTPGVGFKSVTMKCGCGSTSSPKHSICNTTTKACQVVDGAGADTCTTDAQCATVAPTMSCTSITRTPAAAPVVGTKLTFTCLGVVNPSTAGTLSYKFRYSKDSGAIVALANKTTTTAELTITACGSYSVQCQACATLNGVLTCNPTWAGATTQ